MSKAWGAQADSLLVAAACRDFCVRTAPFAHGIVARTQKFPASCRKRQAGSLRSPDFSRSASVIALLLGFALAHGAKADSPLAPATIVVFNSSIPESAALAKFYAQKRGIDRDHLVGLACSPEEEISRDEYERTIANPLREVFRDRKWWTLRESPDAPPTVSGNRIRFVALIKGIPLKVRAVEAWPGDKPGADPIGTRNEASVDSEIALLARFTPQISGAVTNPYYQSFRRIIDFTESSVLLVCRLDAPSASTVRQMIVDATEAEKGGLWGRAYVDGAGHAGGALQMGDRWLGEIVQQFHKTGVPVLYENQSATLPVGYPMSDCALYYGWYAANATGPFTQPEFRFTPGAVAVHIHSFSASTLRDPNANWAAPLLAKGAAAVLGNVYEPYLQLTAHLNIFNDRLLHGFTFAESAYMATQTLSWMSVMVGDPLYRPYASWLEIEARPAAPKRGAEWKMYHEFAVKNASRPAPEFRTLAREMASRARNGAMIEDLGAMEARDGNHAAATSHFQQARTLYTKRDDILRVVLLEAESWIRQEKPRRAVDLVRSVLRIVSDSPTGALLRKIEQDHGAPAAAQPRR